MKQVTIILMPLALSLVGWGATPRATEEPYDFRASAAYAALPAHDRERLEQVHRDFVLLWGALDIYADTHDGKPPESLHDLVPLILRELPPDPFATDATAREGELHGSVPSLEGRGYRYRRGAPGNRAWCLSSVGLPEFPYLAERGNIGLYVCKGAWISGINPRRVQP